MDHQHRFEFIAGSLSLCLVDTFGDRGGSGLERLREPQDLVAWLGATGLLRFDGLVATPADLNGARALREAVYRCGLTAIADASMDEADVALINQFASRPPLRPQLQNGAVVLSAPDPVGAALSTLAADAIATLTAPQRERIRICPECRMMFVDTSRPGRRRWCSSASGCGNRAKVRNHRARRGR